MEMEDKMLVLKKKIKAKFWLDPEKDIIYTNVCTLYPPALRLLADLDLVVDTYIYSGVSCLCLYNYITKH